MLILLNFFWIMPAVILLPSIIFLIVFPGFLFTFFFINKKEIDFNAVLANSIFLNLFFILIVNIFLFDNHYQSIISLGWDLIVIIIFTNIIYIFFAKPIRNQIMNIFLYNTILLIIIFFSTIMSLYFFDKFFQFNNWHYNFKIEEIYVIFLLIFNLSLFVLPLNLFGSLLGLFLFKQIKQNNSIN